MTATYGGETVHITPTQFATIYDVQPLFSDSVLDLHSIKVNGAVLVDGTTAIRLANDRALALATSLATVQTTKHTVEVKTPPDKSPKPRTRVRGHDSEAAEPPYDVLWSTLVCASL